MKLGQCATKGCEFVPLVRSRYCVACDLTGRPRQPDVPSEQQPLGSRIRPRVVSQGETLQAYSLHPLGG